MRPTSLSAVILLEEEYSLQQVAGFGSTTGSCFDPSAVSCNACALLGRKLEMQG